MGIKNLLKVTKSGVTVAQLGKEIPYDLHTESGKRCCIDASHMIHRNIKAVKSKSELLTTSSGKVTQHIRTAAQTILRLHRMGMKQIWIFDNPEANILKAGTNLAREKQRASAADDSTAGFKLSAEEVHDLQTLLGAMGIMYATAPPGIEAEHLCAILTKKDKTGVRFCDYCMTSDTDVLAFGGTLLRIPKKAGMPYLLLDIDIILDSYGITLEDFRKICVCMGTDFCEKAKGIGPATVADKFGKVKFTEEQLAVIAEFGKKVDSSAVKIVNNTFDKAKLIEFLRSLEFSDDTITRTIAGITVAAK
jgi:5'-3' exonuclease